MKKFLLLSSILVNSVAVNAQLGGTRNLNFLEQVAAARVATTGGNLMAIDDAELGTAFYNPSLLQKRHHQSVTLSYVNYFGDINFGFAGFAWNIDSVATFAASIHYMKYGKFEERTETGEKIGEFSIGDYVLNLSAGRAIDTNLSIGANLKIFNSSYYIVNASGAALDLAATYTRRDKGIVAALAMKNIGVMFDSYTEEKNEKFPFEIQFAVSKKLAHAPFRFHMALENLQKWDITYIDPTIKPTIDPVTGQEILPDPPGFGDKLFSHVVFGTELLTKNFSVGAGYNHLRRQELRYSQRGGVAGFSFGLGMRIKKFKFGYSLASYHLAGTSHHLTLEFNLREFGN